MVADRGKDNPLKLAIQETPGLTVVKTRSAFKEPYLKLGKEVSAENGEAQLNPQLLFVAFSPATYSLDIMRNRARSVGFRVAALKADTDDVKVTVAIDDHHTHKVYFGSIHLTEPLNHVSPVTIETQTIYNTEDSDLSKLLLDAQRVRAGEAKTTNTIYIPQRSTIAVFYPSEALAGLAVQLKDYDDEHTGPKPPGYPTNPQGYCGAITNLKRDDFYLFQNGKNADGALDMLGHKYLPDYKSPPRSA